jgi:hypothetical protein
MEKMLILYLRMHDAQRTIRYELLLRRGMVAMRILFLLGIALIIAGGVLEGQDQSSDVSTSIKLVKAGYIVILAFVLSLFLLLTFLWLQASTFPATAKKVKLDSHTQFHIHTKQNRTDVLFPYS